MFKKIKNFLAKFTSEQRDMIGDFCAILLAFIINILAIPVVVLVEYYQSKKGGFPIEVYDIKRRCLLVIMASLMQGLLIWAWR